MTHKIDYSQYTFVVWNPKNFYNSMDQAMIYVPAGAYLAGDMFGDSNSSEPPVPVIIEKDFYMAATATTFGEFDVMSDEMGMKRVGDEGWGRGDRPVVNVNWFMAMLYCQWLSEKEGLIAPMKVTYNIPSSRSWYDMEMNVVPNPDFTDDLPSEKKGYTLPTSLQWQYAARTLVNEEGEVVFGAKVRFGNSKDIADPREINFDASNVANVSYAVNTGDPNIDYRRQTVPVGSLPPSVAGFHEMAGNIWEWCSDSPSGS